MLLTFPFVPDIGKIIKVLAQLAELALAFPLGLVMIIADPLRRTVQEKPVLILPILLIPWTIYAVILCCFISCRRWTSYAVLCIILGCILFANVAGCREVVKDLSHSLT